MFERQEQQRTVKYRFIDLHTKLPFDGKSNFPSSQIRGPLETRRQNYCQVRVLYSQLQNKLFHVVERSRKAAKCTDTKNARVTVKAGKFVSSFSPFSGLLQVPIIVKLPDFKDFNLLILLFLFSDLLGKSLN